MAVPSGGTIEWRPGRSHVCETVRRGKGDIVVAASQRILVYGVCEICSRNGMVSVTLDPGTFPQRGEAECPFGDASCGVVSDEGPEIADVVVSLRRDPRVHDDLW